MDRTVITGGMPLRGEVEISGAKNAALPILASTILGGGECVITNVPRVVDVVTMGKLLGILGAKVHHEGNRAVINAAVITSTQAPYDLGEDHAGLRARVGAAAGAMGRSHGVDARWLCDWVTARQSPSCRTRQNGCGSFDGTWVYSRQSEAADRGTNLLRYADGHRNRKFDDGRVARPGDHGH